MTTKEPVMHGWHWVKADRTLRTGEVVRAGGVYRATGPLVMCRNGLHASRRAVDALKYAPGPIVCAVELVGEILHDDDKSVARERRVLWLADASTILHEFALTVATDALLVAEALGAAVDPRSREALRVKAQWLRGRATDAQLTAAWVAARAAARAAAGVAAWVAVRAAAGDAAWDAAWAAAWAAQNLMLETMLLGEERI